MEQVSSLQSSAIRFCTMQTSGSIFGPEFVEAVRQRYRFWEFPKSPADFRPDEGIKFAHGLFSGVLITNLSLYTSGILVQAESQTTPLDLFIDDFIAWAEISFGCKYVLSAPVSRGYTSAMVVKAPTGITGGFERLNRVSTVLDGMLKLLGITAAPYAISGFTLHADAAKSTPIVPGRFVFERRVDTPVDDRLFYAEAPVPTEQHHELLKHLETVLQGF